jgi:flavodoxin/ferredoxin
MNVLILYFSQTNNTEQIARSIASGIIASGNNADIIPLKEAREDCAEAYDLIGIGTPTFFYREPRNVENFILKMNIASGKHSFIFCTHGSIIGNTFAGMSAELTERGYTVIGAFDCYAAVSMQFYPPVMHTEGHPDAIDREQARKFGKGICARSEKIQKGDRTLVPSFQAVEHTWWADASEKLTRDRLRTISPRLAVNQDKCIRCFQCEEECPADAIDIMNDPPLIQKESCIFCWNCAKTCPERAIEADWTIMRKGAQGNLKKYIEELEVAEREMRFRPLVDYRKITGVS